MKKYFIILFLLVSGLCFSQSQDLPIRNLQLLNKMINTEGDTLIAPYSGFGNIFKNVRRPLDSSDAVPLMTLTDSLAGALVASKISYDTTNNAIIDSITVQGALRELDSLFYLNTHENTIYVKNVGATPIQDVIDTLTGTVSRVLLLDAGLYVGDFTFPATKSLIIKGYFKKTQISGTINWTSTGAGNESIILEDIIFSDGTMNFVTGDASSFKSVWIKGGQVNASQEINFTGTRSDGGHVLHLVDISQVAADINNNGGFIDIQGSQTIGELNNTNSSSGQCLNGEIGNTVNIDGTSQLMVRSCATTFQYIDYNISSGGFLEMDGLTASTANVNYVNKRDFLLLDGNTAGLDFDPGITGDGLGSVILPESRCFLYNNPDNFGYPRVYVIPADTILLTDDANNFIEINYNGGSPEWRVELSNLSNLSNIVCVQQRFREGNDQEETQVSVTGGGLAEKLLKISESRGVVIESGMLLSASGLNFFMSSGSTSCGIIQQAFPDYSSATTTFREYTPTGGVYSYTLKNTLNNTDYVSGGNLVSLLPNKFTVNWIWAAKNDNNLFFTTIHNVQYNTLDDAKEANVNDILALSGFPEIIKEFGIPLGGIIYGTNGVVGTVIQRDAAKGDAPSTIEHNNTTVKQGGDGTDYIHLDQIQYNRVVDFKDSVNANEADPVYISDTSRIGFLDTDNIFTGQLTANNYISSVSTGTQPYAAASTTLNTNLNADLLDSQQGSYYLARANHTGTQTASTISDFDTEVSNNTDVAANTSVRHNAVTLAGGADYLSLLGQQITQDLIDTTSTNINRSNWLSFLDNKYIGLDEKGSANGVATLDGSAKIPISQIPDALIGAVVYQGTWNASTNTPTITSSVGTKGHYYTVNVAGNTIIDGTGNWKIGDMIIFNGIIWEKIDNNHDVISVNGKTGTVVITTSSNTTGQLTVTNGSTDPQLNIITGTIVNGGTALATGNQIYDYVDDRETPFNEFKVSIDGENNFTTTFTIKVGATVFYNGRIIETSNWSGEGTTTLTITFPRYINDLIQVYND